MECSGFELLHTGQQVQLRLDSHLIYHMFLTGACVYNGQALKDAPAAEVPVATTTADPDGTGVTEERPFLHAFAARYFLNCSIQGMVIPDDEALEVKKKKQLSKEEYRSCHAYHVNLIVSSRHVMSICCRCMLACWFACACCFLACIHDTHVPLIAG